MPVFTFRGRVEPETLDLSIAYEPVIKVADSELFGAADFNAKVEDGQMTIEVTVEDDKQDYANLLYTERVGGSNPSPPTIFLH